MIRTDNPAFEDETFSYDAVGNRISGMGDALCISIFSDNITSKKTEHGDYEYGYDPLYRVISTDNPAFEDETFSYDAVGNRTSDNKVEEFKYNGNNELLFSGSMVLETSDQPVRTIRDALESVTLSKSEDSADYAYDANGNMVRKTIGETVTRYVYNIEDRLSEVWEDKKLVAKYYYDPFGRRLWKEVAGVKTYFHYADEGLVGEYDAKGKEIRSYGYAPDSTWTTDPAFVKTDGKYYFYHNDHLGTPQKITDKRGTVAWSAVYDTFGKASVDEAATIDNPLRFAGQYFDAETGLHYNFHRYYDPRVGRYVTADPIGLEGGINPYVFSKNNTIVNLDPWGLLAATVCERCIGETKMKCKVNEDGEIVDEFETNSWKNDTSKIKTDKYGTNGPLPAGTYEMPNAFSPKFQRRLPSPTNTGNPGVINTPGGTKRVGIRVHRGTFSQGCLTLGPGNKGAQIEKDLTNLVDKNSNSGGTILIIKDVCCN